MATTEGVGFQVNWIDQNIDRIMKAQGQYRLTQNSKKIMEKIEGK